MYRSQALPCGNIPRPRLAVYREVSPWLSQLFVDLKRLVEPIALDEAFLDVTSIVRNQVEKEAKYGGKTIDARAESAL
jgi:DNA polymerase-4